MRGSRCNTDGSRISVSARLNVSANIRVSYKISGLQRDPRILDIAILVELRLLMLTEVLNGVRIQTPHRIHSRVETNEDEQLDNNCSCSICWDDKELINFVKLDCNHEFCKDCIIATTAHNHGKVPCCALCRAEVRTVISRTDEIQTEILQVIR